MQSIVLGAKRKTNKQTLHLLRVFQNSSKPSYLKKLFSLYFVFCPLFINIHHSLVLQHSLFLHTYTEVRHCPQYIFIHKNIFCRCSEFLLCSHIFARVKQKQLKSATKIICSYFLLYIWFWFLLHSKSKHVLLYNTLLHKHRVEY